MSIITCATSKGGAGKTTIAQLLLGSLSRQGYRVAGLDADFNRTLSNWVNAITPHTITIRTEVDETKVVPTVSELEDTHDLVVVDTAGAATQATVFAIGSADLVIVPIQASSSDIVEAIKTVNLVRSASEMVKRTIPVRVLFTDYPPHTNVAEHTEREVDRYELPLMRTRLHRLVGFKEMTFTGVVPHVGRAGEQIRALLREVQELGALPFYDHNKVVEYE